MLTGKKQDKAIEEEVDGEGTRKAGQKREAEEGLTEEDHLAEEAKAEEEKAEMTEEAGKGAALGRDSKEEDKH